MTLFPHIMTFVVYLVYIYVFNRCFPFSLHFNNCKIMLFFANFSNKSTTCTIMQVKSDMFLIQYPSLFTNVTYRIRLFTGFVITKATRTGAPCGAGSAHSSRAPEITPSFWLSSCCLVFSFLCCVFCTIICLFVFLF